MDCTVLKKGYEAFRLWMLKCTKLDIDNYITLQSLSRDYKLKTVVMKVLQCFQVLFNITYHVVLLAVDV